MAIVVEGVGAADSSSPYTPAVFGPTLADEIILLLVEQNGSETTVTASGYAHVTGSPVNVDGSTQLSVFWKRSAGGETSATVSGTVNHAMCRTVTISGVRTSGNPWNVTPAAAQETAANTSAEWSTVTTTVVDCLVVLCIATGRNQNSTANMGAVTNGNLTSITERMDNWTTSAAGGGVGMVTGFKATASAVGTSTATMGSTDAKALLTIALEPAATGTSATAENAAGVGAANDPQATIALSPTNAAGAGAASDTQASVGAPGSTATVAAAASDITAAVATNAQNAAGVGAAQDLNGSVAVNLTTATATGEAQNVAAAIGTTAVAENAAVTGTASDIAAAVTASLSEAAATGSAGDLAASASVTLETASAAAAANDLPVQTGGNVSAAIGTAEGAAEAQQAQAGIGGSLLEAIAAAELTDLAAAADAVLETAAADGFASGVSLAAQFTRGRMRTATARGTAMASVRVRTSVMGRGGRTRYGPGG